MRIDVFNQAFFRLEIERHRVVFVGVAADLEHWRSREFAQRVGHTRRIDEARVQIHMDLLALEVHVLVFHVRLAVKIGHFRASVIDDRVVRNVFHRRVDAVFATAVERVESNAVVDGAVVAIDGQFERVHRGRIDL